MLVCATLLGWQDMIQWLLWDVCGIITLHCSLIFEHYIISLASQLLLAARQLISKFKPLCLPALQLQIHFFTYKARAFTKTWVFSSFQEWANAMARRLSSVRPSTCKLLSKSFLLTGKWPDRHQTCTRWTPGQRASRVCSRLRSKVTWYAPFFGFLEWGTLSLTVWLF